MFSIFATKGKHQVGRGSSQVASGGGLRELLILQHSFPINCTTGLALSFPNRKENLNQRWMLLCGSKGGVWALRKKEAGCESSLLRTPNLSVQNKASPATKPLHTGRKYG